MCRQKPSFLAFQTIQALFTTKGRFILRYEHKCVIVASRRLRNRCENVLGVVAERLLPPHRRDLLFRLRAL
jgi:hypothetical protein